jgi:capsular polysaccharide biosynthesis protein
MAQTYAQLATTGPVMTSVAQDLGLETSPELLAEQVTTELQPEGTLLSIIVRDRDADRAAAIANGVAARLQELAPRVDEEVAARTLSRLAELDAQIAASETRLLDLLALERPTSEQAQQLADAQQRLASLTQARTLVASNLPGASPNTLTIVDVAATPTASVGPSRALMVAAFAAGAVALSVALAYILAAWRGSGAARRPSAPGMPVAPTDLEPQPLGGVGGRGSRVTPSWPHPAEDPHLRP